MIFKAKGHKNLLGTHATTLEFTKDLELTLKGDCIIGVKSDFSVEELKKLKGKIKITLSAAKITGNVSEKESDIITAEINPYFNDDREMVIRTSDFTDKRTFAVNATKAAKDINRELIEKLKNPDTELHIKIEEIN